MDNKRSVIHCYLCTKIIEKSSNQLVSTDKLDISVNDFRKMLGWFNIPYYLQWRVINEMKQMNLIKIKNKQNITLIKQKDKDNGWFD